MTTLALLTLLMLLAWRCGVASDEGLRAVEVAAASGVCLWTAVVAAALVLDE